MGLFRAERASTIVGIDPGLTATGVAILRGEELVAAQVLRTSRRDGPDAARIAAIVRGLDALLSAAEGDGEVLVAVERQHGAWGRTEAEIRGRAAAAHRIAAVRGAVTTWAQARGAEVVEIAPQTAKRALVGHGHASKAQMCRMAGSRFGRALAEDAADALGIALAAAARRRGRTR